MRESSFRHSYRAWLDELGTPISVQQRHGDIRVTMNGYGNPVNDALKRRKLENCKTGNQSVTDQK